MNKRDELFDDFRKEKIDEQTLQNIVGGKDEKPTKSVGDISNDAHTMGDVGDCDVDAPEVCWTLDY